MMHKVSESLETHLFFARIMKEHGLFLEAGFVCADAPWVQRAGWFMRQFEELLGEALKLSGGQVSRDILDSCELVTGFTLSAEQCTGQLAGVEMDTRLTEEEKKLKAGCARRAEDAGLQEETGRLNRRALRLLDDFIVFKESILQLNGEGRLFTFNYPLLVEHILREARLYRETVALLLGEKEPCEMDREDAERFWNRIMMEHALFIRGLLDPSEEELIETANGFAGDYRKLLELAKQQDDRVCSLTEASRETTRQFCRFKAAGTKGILNCEIRSVILPLFADHVLREANHYLRILGDGEEKA